MYNFRDKLNNRGLFPVRRIMLAEICDSGPICRLSLESSRNYVWCLVVENLQSHPEDLPRHQHLQQSTANTVLKSWMLDAVYGFVCVVLWSMCCVRLTQKQNLNTLLSCDWGGGFPAYRTRNTLKFTEASSETAFLQRSCWSQGHLRNCQLNARHH